MENEKSTVSITFLFRYLSKTPFLPNPFSATRNLSISCMAKQTISLKNLNSLTNVKLSENALVGKAADFRLKRPWIAANGKNDQGAKGQINPLWGLFVPFYDRA